MTIVNSYHGLSIRKHGVSFASSAMIFFGVIIIGETERYYQQDYDADDEAPEEDIDEYRLAQGVRKR